MIIRNICIAILIIVLILAGVFLYMIKPNRKRDTSYFQKKMYAHRGLHDHNVPENSITAFRLAREAGYGVELDVQMTKDGKLVVFHDGNLKRMCGVDGLLKDYTYEELEKFSLNDTNEKIPLFSDVLETLGETDLICEIKSDNGIKNYALCKQTYDMLNTYRGRFCVESFSPYLMGWFKREHPEIIRGQLSENFVKTTGFTVLNLCLTHLMGNVISRPDFVAYNHLYSDTFGFKAVRFLFNPMYVAWTARGEEEQDKAWKKFDAVIFEKEKRE